MYYIGIDLGGMSVKAGLVDEEGHEAQNPLQVRIFAERGGGLKV